MREIKIGNVIKRVLRDQRKTLKEVSQETGIPYSTLHTWQQNRQPKDILKVQRLADYLGLSLPQLLFDQSEVRERRLGEALPPSIKEFLNGTFEIIVRRLS